MILPLSEKYAQQVGPIITVGEKQPSKTYRLDTETGEIYAEFIDNTAAVAQAVVKAIKTMRSKYLIYSSDYGCEISYLLGRGFSQEYLEIEVPRFISEALMPDDRVERCINFTIVKVESTLNVTFEVITDIGENIQVEVEI